MTIETKYNVKDEVWIIYDNKPLLCRIIYISINIQELTNGIAMGKNYSLASLKGSSPRSSFLETDLFKTKEELIASL